MTISHSLDTILRTRCWRYNTWFVPSIADIANRIGIWYGGRQSNYVLCREIIWSTSMSNYYFFLAWFPDSHALLPCYSVYIVREKALTSKFWVWSYNLIHCWSIFILSLVIFVIFSTILKICKEYRTTCGKCYTPRIELLLIQS